MNWFKNLYNRVANKSGQAPGETKPVQGEPDMVIYMGSNKADSEQTVKKQTNLTPDTIVVTDTTLKKIFKDFLEQPMWERSFLFFDPEELNCFIYRIYDNGRAQIQAKLPSREWKILFSQLTPINNNLIQIDESVYSCIVSISFTNLGERTAVKLYPETFPDQDKLKDERRKEVQLINKIKPATALTMENIENLLNLIAEHGDKANGDFHSMLIEDGIIQPNEVQPGKDIKYFKSILYKPIARKLLVKTLARWFGFEYFDVELGEINKEIARTVPPEVTEKIRAIAFSAEDDSIKAAFWNPFDTGAVNTLKQILGKEIIPCMSCEEDIRYEIERLYSD